MTKPLSPPAHTPLAALPALFLDTETTGLDVRSDRVVQVAALAAHGSEILAGPRLERLADPGVPIPAAATRIHGIGAAEVAGAARFADIAAELQALFAGRVVIGHHVGFDLAVLRHEAARAGIAWHEPAVLDLAQLVGALYPTLPDLSLETVATHLGVVIDGRHSALGDCQAAAEAWLRLLPLLREADVRTLGEAQTLAARRDDLLLRQAQMGWHDVPGGPAPVRAAPVPPRIDSDAFVQRLAALMSAPPVSIIPRTTLRDAAATMVERRVGALLVADKDAPPVGIVTERDLLRAAALEDVDLDRTPVTRHMSAPVAAMDGEEMLYSALGRMDRLGIRHLAVTGPGGAVIGMLSQRDLLHHRARGAEMLGDALAVANDVPELAAAYARVPEIAERLVAEGLDGVGVARFVSAELRTLAARAAELTQARLAHEGRGPPPARWCLLLLGSGGRRESLLGADQDHALVHEGGSGDDPWFAALGAGVAELLDRAGVPYCAGGVMASRPDWRGTPADWRARVDDWLRRAGPEDLIFIDLFFDMAPVAGDAELARALRDDALRAASANPPFLALLARSVIRFAPRLGLFGSLRVDDGRADLKRDGLLPLVSLARGLALRLASATPSTPGRLRDAAAAGRLAERDAETLVDLHEELLSLILAQQLVDLQDGVRPSARVALKRLSRRQRTRLRHGLRRLDEIVGELPGAMGP